MELPLCGIQIYLAVWAEASPTRTPDIRYSDVARYVGLCLGGIGLHGGARASTPLKFSSISNSEISILIAEEGTCGSCGTLFSFLISGHL